MTAAKDMTDMAKIFIDGSAGTTGLRIRERLSGRSDLTLITLPEEKRKDPAARREALNAADVAFLCLPDEAAREAVSLVSNPDTVIIDTSTAHRTAAGWVYGFPELPGARERIRSSKRIANPGCHATGFIALVAPLVAAGVIRPEARLTCFSLTGYSGGGKKMIADYEAGDRSPLLSAPRQYGLSQQHKHLPEMALISGLAHPPVFSPVVAPYFAGMEVTVPLTEADTGASPEEIAEVYRKFYDSGMVRFSGHADEGGCLSAGAFAGRDDLEIAVFGITGRTGVVSRFDNLVK